MGTGPHPQSLRSAIILSCSTHHLPVTMWFNASPQSGSKPVCFDSVNINRWVVFLSASCACIPTVSYHLYSGRLIFPPFHQLASASNIPHNKLNFFLYAEKQALTIRHLFHPHQKDSSSGLLAFYSNFQVCHPYSTSPSHIRPNLDCGIISDLELWKHVRPCMQMPPWISSVGARPLNHLESGIYDYRPPFRCPALIHFGQGRSYFTGCIYGSAA